MIISKEKSAINKIGIVAPFKDYNYGTVLQAYALSYLFKKQGVSAEYIDYLPLDGTESLFYKAKLCLKHPSLLYKKLFGKQTINPIISFFATDTFRPIKEEYDKFIACIPSSKTVTLKDLKRIKSDYASFCVGSDQTWSPFIVDDLSLNFLSFIDDSKKKNSYAPSIGTAFISDKFKKLLKKNLKNFNVISCRDYYGSKVLSNVLGRHVENVLDPTLLMTKEEWTPLIEELEVPKPYVLCYQLGTKEILIGFSRRLCEQFGLPLIIIPTNEYTSSQPECLKSVSPRQFLYLVKNARYVVTDSFHGTLFSINFGIQFFSFSKVAGNLNTFDNIRIVELLESFGIKDRFVEGNESCVPDDIDYTDISKELQQRREKSQLIINRIAETV